MTNNNPDDFVRCNVRFPQSLYQKIAAIAIGNGAKIHPRSQRPHLSATLIDLLTIGLQHYSEPSLQPTAANEIESLKAWMLTQQGQQLERFHQLLAENHQFQQTTQTQIHHLQDLVHQLCDRLNTLTVHPITQAAEDFTYYPDQWTVNHQWLIANSCFSQQSFETWQTGEVRQDQQGRSWRRVELAHLLGEFKMPPECLDSQVLYVRE